MKKLARQIIIAMVCAVAIYYIVFSISQNDRLSGAIGAGLGYVVSRFILWKP